MKFMKRKKETDEKQGKENLQDSFESRIDAEESYEEFVKAYQCEHDHPYRILFALFKGHGLRMFFTAVFLLLKESPVWVLPLITAAIINAATYPAQHKYGEIVGYAVIGLIFLLQNIATSFIQVRLLSKMIREIELKLRSTLVRKLQRLSISFHKDMQSGKILSKVMRDVENVEMLLYMSAGNLINIILDTVVALVVIGTRNPLVLLFFILVIPVAVGAVYGFRKPIRDNNSQFRREVEETQAAVAEMVEMIPVTRAHGLEDQEIRRMDERLRHIWRTGYRLDQINMLFGATSWVIFQAFQVLCLVFSGTMAYYGKITIGEVVLYQNYFAQIVSQVANLISMYPNLAKGMESIKSIGEIIEDDDIEPNNAIIPLQQLKGRVTFTDVSFRYADGDHDILKDFNLEVPAGSSVAFVGGSGAGKSTLLNLLIGFYRPTQGRILIDGIHMNNLDMKEYRSQIAVVPQNTILFSGTIRDNVAYGLPCASDEEVRAVLKDVGLLDMIEQMPKGIYTSLGEHGDTLSGGQRQRISIARALLRKPKIIIFDEATSALDSVSEKQIQEAAGKMMETCTTFLVAHRLSTIEHADMICVIRDGRIAEQGSYEELMAKRGLFYEMKKLQQ